MRVCPTCDLADQVQSVEAIYMTGGSSSAGTFQAVSLPVAVTAGRINTQTTTNIAKVFAPPTVQASPYPVGFALVFSCGSIGAYSPAYSAFVAGVRTPGDATPILLAIGLTVATIVSIVLAVLVEIRSSNARRDDLPRNLELWRNTCYCSRCSKVFDPETRQYCNLMDAPAVFAGRFGPQRI